jgi:hypothetical protein
MDPSLRKGIKRRTDWIRRNPGSAGDYIRLTKADRDKVDALFLAERKLQPNEVSSLVERLTEKRLARRRVGDYRRKALENLRGNLGDRERYRDSTVAKNVAKMTPSQAKMAAAATTDQLVDLARIQEEGNPFWYH